MPFYYHDLFNFPQGSVVLPYTSQMSRNKKEFLFENGVDTERMFVYSYSTNERYLLFIRSILWLDEKKA
jgi:hypothetical protein